MNVNGINGYGDFTSFAGDSSCFALIGILTSAIALMYRTHFIKFIIKLFVTRLM